MVTISSLTKILNMTLAQQLAQKLMTIQTEITDLRLQLQQLKLQKKQDTKEYQDLEQKIQDLNCSLTNQV